MSNQQDMLIWKLDNDLTRARLALGRIYNIVSKVYCPETKHASSSIDRDEVDKIIETTREFFNYDKLNRNRTRCSDNELTDGKCGL